ncbi:MAG TPA: flagellar motor protein MotB [Desulfomonilia bacterium]|nr:flagellar motor protein MotB [Desulfomonilia bacterium]
MKRNKNVLIVKMPSRLNWMTTFCDMLTILLCFFVLIISMSSMESKALKNTFGFFNSVTGVLEFPQQHEVTVVPPTVKTKPDIIQLEAGSLNRSLVISLKKQNVLGIPGRGTDNELVKETSRGFAIRVPDEVVFDKASTSVKKDAEPVLKGIANAVKGLDVIIAIEGHTDNVGSEQANWKLSLQRAISIADFFVYNQGMSPDRLCVAGYGAMKPVAANDTEGGRGKNRRVEIILLKDRI